MSEKNIYQKLLAVRKTVEYLKKEATGHKYNYTKESQIIGALRPAMDDEGLFLEVEMLPITWGMDGSVPVVSIQFTWVNCDKPEERVKSVFYFPCTNASDPKMIGAILTYSVRYALTKQFQIATDELDIDAFQEKSMMNATSRKPTIDIDQVDVLDSMIRDDEELRNLVVQHIPGGVLKNLTQERYPKVIEFINRYHDTRLNNAKKI